MRSLVLSLAIAAAATIQANAAPTASKTDKWGVYTTLAQHEWWLSESGPILRYSWAVLGEQLKLEQFEADGTLTYSTVMRIEGNNLVNGTISRATITSVGPTHINFGSDDTMQLDEGLFQLEHRFTYNGKPMMSRFDRVRPPLFPSAELRANFSGKITCPPTKAALRQMLASLKTGSTQKEQPVVDAGNGLFLGGYAGERRYDPTSLQILGVRPTKVVTAISGGQPFNLEAMLPSHDPRRYEPSFRAAFPRGQVRCDEYGCHWRSRRDTWDEAEGTLINSSISQVIDSDTELRFLCQYR